MQATADIILPVFALIIAGYGVAKTPLLTRQGVIGLNNFVYYVAIPALLFHSMARGVNVDAQNIAILLSYFGAAAIVFLMVLVLTGPLFAIAFAERSIFAMGSVFSNTVLIGIPLIYMAFGEAGVEPVMTNIALHSSLLITATTILVEIGRSGRANVAAALAAAFWAVVANPVLIALAAGVFWGWAEWPVPAAAARFIDLLRGAAAPCALFAMGAALVDYRLGGEMRQTVVMVLVKLLGMPALVWLLAAHVFVLEPLWVAVATVTAALPGGTNVYILAQRYEIYVARAASGVLISTALSLLTLAFLIQVFAAG